MVFVSSEKNIFEATKVSLVLVLTYLIHFLSATTSDYQNGLIDILSPINGSIVLDDGTIIEYVVSQRAQPQWNVNLYLNMRLAFKGSERTLKVSVPGLLMGHHILQAFMTDENDQQVSAQVHPFGWI